MTDIERAVETIEHQDKMLKEAIKIIMNEWGYTREQTIDWLNRKVEGDD